MGFAGIIPAGVIGMPIGSTGGGMADEDKFARIPLLDCPTPRLSQLIQANLAVKSDVFHSELPSVLISPLRQRSM